MRGFTGSVPHRIVTIMYTHVVRNNYKLRAFTIQQDFIKGMALGMS
jgi:hypothetical protein